MIAPDWLCARPIAHRGLHDRAAGIVENTLAAAEAAAVAGYAIECDVQISSDGEAMVCHDFTLDRLMQASGRVDAQSAAALAGLAPKTGRDGIVALDVFLAAIGGRVPLVCEIKSRFDGDMRLARRTAAVVAAQAGPVALKSFDPDVIATLRRERAALGLDAVPLGVVAEARYDYDEWRALPDALRRRLAHFLHYSESRPDFLSWSVRDLPHAVPCLCRDGIGLPVMTWTVRSADIAAAAAPFVDQIVFEGFRA